MADFDEDSIQKFLRSIGIDQLNSQTTQIGKQASQVGNQMLEAAIPQAPAQNPFAGSGGGGKKGIVSTIGSIAAPVMKVGGMALSAAGMPYVGVPLSIAGSAVGGGAEGGITGALKGGIQGGLSQAIPAGLGKGLDFLKSPVGDSIDIASKGLTIPGKRLASLDLGNMTVPKSPTSFGGGMS